jgi:16S rRNA pseudouridine516 synthase
MRLDKYLSQATGLSRKEVKRLMHKNTVTVNGELVRDPSLHISLDDNVVFNDGEVAAPTPRYLMMNKPEGVVCANDDPLHPTVISLLYDEPRPDSLHTVGRLDIDTTGLILITDDGQWSHRVTAPKHKMPKRYRVTTVDPIPESAIDDFAQGVQLHNEPQLTKPASLVIINQHEAFLTLTEGKYHQVKRMFAAIGNKVETLHRDAIADVLLDDTLAPGEYRELTQQEQELLGV